MLLLFTSIHDPLWAMGAMSLSTFAAELSGPISWTTVMDLGGRYVGTLSAAMNMMGHFGGSVAPTPRQGEAGILRFFARQPQNAVGKHGVRS